MEFVTPDKFWTVFFKVSGFGAITLPGRKVVMMRHLMFDEAVIKHEIAHVEQMEREGTTEFTINYLINLFRYGYRNHPDEREARDYENK